MQSIRFRSAVMLVAAFVVGVGSAQPAVAQTPAPPAANPELRVGRTVWVTTTDGIVIHGKIKAVSDAELGLISGQTAMAIPLPKIRLVEAKDSLANGLGMGVLVGVGSGVLIAAAVGGALGGSPDGATIIGGVLTGVMFAVPLGLLIDHAHTGKQPIYRPATQVSLGPLVAPGRLGVGGTLRW